MVSARRTSGAAGGVGAAGQPSGLDEGRHEPPTAGGPAGPGTIKRNHSDDMSAAYEQAPWVGTDQSRVSHPSAGWCAPGPAPECSFP